MNEAIEIRWALGHSSRALARSDLVMMILGTQSEVGSLKFLVFQLQ